MKVLSTLLLAASLTLAVAQNQQVFIDQNGFMAYDAQPNQQLNQYSIFQMMEQPPQPIDCSMLDVQVFVDKPFCRGFHFPNHTRYCVTPGDTVGLSVILTNKADQTMNLMLDHARVHSNSLLDQTITLAADSPRIKASQFTLFAAPVTMNQHLSINQQATLTLNGLMDGATKATVGVFDTFVSLRVNMINPPANPMNAQFNQQQNGQCVFKLPVQFEYSCDDGIFCNGPERFIDGQCVPGKPPCEDNDDCTSDVCDEQYGRCRHELSNATDCVTHLCQAPTCLAQCPPNAQCGGNGCGGNCGICQAGYECRAFQCAPSTGEFTCAKPYSLFKDEQQMMGSHEFLIDMHALGLGDSVWPACADYGQQPDAIMKFTIPDSFTQGVGVDLQLHGQHNENLDTVLEVRHNRCEDTPRTADTTTAEGGKDFACSNDSEPPGGQSSRIVALLSPGDYYLVASLNPVFEDRPVGDGSLFHTVFPPELPANVSDRQLRLNMRMVPGYIPDCRQKRCGSDGQDPWGCGKCASDEHCTADFFQCEKNVCVANCSSRTCGTDGCGGSCGDCKHGDGCTDEGQCMADPQALCDSMRPTCSPSCGAGKYCAADCHCHSVDEPLPDLIVKIEDLVSDLSLANLNFSKRSCALQEGCINSDGVRRVLRFSVAVLNQGHADVVLAQPKNHPLSFVWSQCHQHFHYKHFASYTLIKNGTVAVEGHKQAFCLEDTKQEIPGKHSPCLPRFNCTNPGIQRGWSDVYGADLDCQWTEATDLEPGLYQLRVEINNERTILESSYENNVALIEVNIQ